MSDETKIETAEQMAERLRWEGIRGESLPDDRQWVF